MAYADTQVCVYFVLKWNFILIKQNDQHKSILKPSECIVFDTKNQARLLHRKEYMCKCKTPVKFCVLTVIDKGWTQMLVV